MFKDIDLQKRKKMTLVENINNSFAHYQAFCGKLFSYQHFHTFCESFQTFSGNIFTKNWFFKLLKNLQALIKPFF